MTPRLQAWETSATSVGASAVTSVCQSAILSAIASTGRDLRKRILRAGWMDMKGGPNQTVAGQATRSFAFFCAGQNCEPGR